MSNCTDDCRPDKDIDGQADPTDRLHVLFVCSKNRWRSPTAERLWRDDQRLSVRSRGTSSRAARSLRRADLDWADLVLVMEKRHRSRIWQRFGRDCHDSVRILDIPDDFELMDPALVRLLRDRVEIVLDSYRDADEI